MKRLALAALLFATPALGLDTSAGEVTLTRMASGLTEPWALGFLPDGGWLITERGGHLWRYDAAGAAQEVTGLPEVVVGGQGGLLDLLVPRDFAEKGELLFTYVAPVAGGRATTLATARLEGTVLTGLRVLFTTPGAYDTDYHFGGRVVELPDGTLVLATGERGQGMAALDPATGAGKLWRIARDGSVPEGNPFPGSPLYTLGHRNPQGLTVAPDGTLWASEHGAKGGDEINLIEPGLSYGWPLAGHGTNYDGSKIGVGPEAPGITNAAHYWDPSIAPSGHLVYSGKLWPAWRGDHFLGSLKFDYLSHMDPDSSGTGGWGEEVIRSRETGRVRDVREAPDGAIWFLSVDRGAAYRMAPAP